jgi:hypothetical protein
VGEAVKDIRTDEDLVRAVSGLKHALKAGLPYTPLREDFNRRLNEFIEEHGLGWDPHEFARMSRTSVRGGG